METYRIDLGALRATCARALPPDTARTWLAERAEWILGGNRGTADQRAERAALGGVQVVVKRESRRGAQRILDGLRAREGRPARAFRTGVALLGHGVPAARPLLLLEESHLAMAMERRTAVVLEDAPGKTLRELIAGGLAPLEAEARERQKRGALAAVASAVARLHAARARQRDLKAPNIVLHDEGGCLRATLIDLEGMRLLCGAPTWRGRARDLSRLAASLRTPEALEAGIGDADWAAFIAMYLEQVGGPRVPARARDLYERTLAWARWKEERNRRLGRVLH